MADSARYIFDDPHVERELVTADQQQTCLRWFRERMRSRTLVTWGQWSPYPYKDDRAVMFMGGDTVVPGCACDACLSLDVHHRRREYDLIRFDPVKP